MDEKYKEALNRAWAIREDGYKNKDVQETVEYIFPQLKQEKNMKEFIQNELACICALEDKGSDRYNKLTEAIKWLDKEKKEEQVSQSLLGCTEKESDEDEKIRNEILEYFLITRVQDFVAKPERQKWISYIEKQKEYPTNEEMLRTLRAEYEKGVADTIVKYEQKEQTEELSTSLNGLMQEYVKSGKDEEEQEHRLKCYQLFWDALGDSEFFKYETIPLESTLEYKLGFKAGKESEKQKEQKPFPKFKVGDTIHCKYDDREFTIKSVDLTNMVYKYTKEGCGNDIDYADEDFELVEQKPTEIKTKGKEYLQGLLDGKCLVLEHPEKYDLYELTEWSEDNIKELTEFEAAMLHIGLSFFGGSAGLNPNNTNEVKKQAKLLLELVPKQEWSEEDKEMFRIISNRIEKFDEWATEQGYPIDDPTMKQSPIDWLKDLPERFNIQPKQEWSEEDECRLNNIIHYLPLFGKDAEWIKSLKNRVSSQKGSTNSPSWKPSKEQMKALKVSNSYWQGLTKEVPKTNELESLYNNLKKL